MYKPNKSINKFEPSLKNYFKDLKKCKPLSRDEEIELCRRYRTNHDLAARNRLVTANLQYVAKVARCYEGKGLSYSDLIAEGNIGLMKSIERFDETKGNKLISYSVWWIKQTILEALNKRNGISGDDFPNNEHQEEDNDDLIQPQKNPEDGLFIEESDSFKNENSETLSMILQSLNEREKTIIAHYYGLGVMKQKTYEEIGKMLSLTKERVRQIAESALLKMRCSALCV